MLSKGQTHLVDGPVPFVRVLKNQYIEFRLSFVTAGIVIGDNLSFVMRSIDHAGSLQ